MYHVIYTVALTAIKQKTTSTHYLSIIVNLHKSKAKYVNTCDKVPQ